RAFPGLSKDPNRDGLMAQLMGRLPPVRAGGAKSAAGAGGLVAVYSASGGPGKPPLASGLAEWLAASGRRTFYLNMERIPGLAAGPSDVRLRFARVLYHLRRGERDALMALATRHPERGFDWFPPAAHAGEWDEDRGRAE